MSKNGVAEFESNVAHRLQLKESVYDEKCIAFFVSTALDGFRFYCSECRIIPQPTHFVSRDSEFSFETQLKNIHRKCRQAFI